MTMERESLLGRLARLKAKGSSFVALGKALGVAPITVSRWLSGERYPREATQKQLAALDKLLTRRK